MATAPKPSTSQYTPKQPSPKHLKTSRLQAETPTLTFTWNTTGFAKGNYTISAYAEPVPGEILISDNNFTYGTVYVGIPGDVDGNGIVDIKDIFAMAKAYGSYPGKPNWNPNLDVNGDAFIDIRDIFTAAKNYGQYYP